MATKDRGRRQSHAPFGIPTLPRIDAIGDIESLQPSTERGTEPEPLPPPPVEESIPHMPAIQRPVPAREKVVANRYEILEKVGTGGMGNVFKVRHLELDKQFALKIIHREMSENQHARDMFYAEARMASRLEHRNIVNITDFGEDIRRGAFIVMEFLKGESLADRLDRERRQPVNTACDVISQTAEALSFMHGAGVIHGDIKPENVFLCRAMDQEDDRRRNWVKVLDFGLSRMSRGQFGKTGGDKLAGTPAYLAPERAVGAVPDEASDLYALGVLFYEILTGEVPFDGNVAQILNAHINTPPTPPSWRLGKGALDERLDDLILTCLAKDPIARFASIRHFQDELGRHMEESGMSRRRRQTPPQPPTAGPGDAAWRSMVESNPLPMFALDAEGRFTMLNKSFGLFIKKSSKDLVGRLVQDTRLGKYCPGLVEDLQVVLENNKVTSRELEFSLGKNRMSKVLIWLAPLGVGGIIIGAHGIVHWIQK